MKEPKYKCPLCGKRKVEVYEICEICMWEYDPVVDDPDSYSNANHVSLNEAKEWYGKYGKKWSDEWWKQVEEHYGNAKDAYKQWCDDPSGWKPEP